MTGWIATFLLMAMVGVGIMVFLLPYIIIGSIFALPAVGAYYFMRWKRNQIPIITHKQETLDEL